MRFRKRVEFKGNSEEKVAVAKEKVAKKKKFSADRVKKAVKSFSSGVQNVSSSLGQSTQTIATGVLKPKRTEKLSKNTTLKASKLQKREFKERLNW